MSTTYKIVGGDGNEYGPIALDQLKGWIREGRLNGDSYVAREGDTAWSKASDFPELGVQAGAVAIPPLAVNPAAAKPAKTESFNHPQAEYLLSQVKSATSWFWWIAALTGINMVTALANIDWGFALGLGICQIVDHFAVEGGAKIVGVIFDLFAVGLVVLVGWFAGKAKPWAFMLGMVLFGLDTIIFILGFAIIPILIHGWAVFSFWRGFAAAKELRSSN